MSEQQVAMLEEALCLLAARTEHYGCEDGWYACPKSPDWIRGYEAPCECGADEILEFFARWGLDSARFLHVEENDQNR